MFQIERNDKTTWVALIGGLLITLATYFVAAWFGWVVFGDVSTLEIIGVTLNYACVWLTARQKINAWPIGIIAVIAMGVVFWQVGLYASLVLSIGYFLPVQFIGWYKWRKTEINRISHAQISAIEPSTLTNTQRTIWGASAAPIYGAVFYTNSWLGGSVAFADSAILVLSVIAQYLLNDKKIESWVIWAIVNVISVYTYATAGAYLFALQYLLFLFNAGYGFWKWSK